MEQSTLKEGLDKLKTVTGIRREISAIYSRYHSYTKVVESLSRGKVKHFDVKKAVDAIHYFGGGWPRPSSKGRMEAILDAMAGMFKVLWLIGEGNMVVNHLRKHGIEITIRKRGELPNWKLDEQAAEWVAEKYNLEKPEYFGDLVEQVVMVCDDLQGIICAKSDIIRDHLRPDIEEALGIDRPEYDRLADLMKLKLGSDKTQERVPSRIEDIEESIDHFDEASQVIKRVNKREL